MVWEIGNVARDKVSGLESLHHGRQRARGGGHVTYDFDRLELEKVEPDYIEGWEVWPGRISYSHTGYQSGAPKAPSPADCCAGVPLNRPGDR